MQIKKGIITMTAPKDLDTIPEHQIVKFTTAVYLLQDLLSHINLEHRDYGLCRNALYKLLPPKKTCELWQEEDIDTWCEYTYKYLNHY